MIGRTAKSARRNRARVTPGQGPTAPPAVGVLTIDAADLLVTTSVPVIVNGLPTGITRQAAGAGPQLLPSTVTILTPTTFKLHYAANLVATDIVTVPSNVAEVRTNQGGFLAAASKTF